MISSGGLNNWVASPDNIGMTHFKLRRSVLYTPGSNPAVLLKAVRSKADVLIFDLEDAVAPERKIEARLAVAQALANPHFDTREIVVRVNAIGTPWCEGDLELLARSGASAFLFPKVNNADDVRRATSMLSFYSALPSTELWCMIETPTAILNAQDMARCGGENSRMTTWVLGTNDLVKDLRAQHTPGREGLVPMLAIAVAAARAGGLCVLDGVHNDVKDAVGFKFTCKQGRQMGFDGRTLIHPSQIDSCNEAYSPSVEEVQEARAIVHAFSLPENRGKGVIQVDGRMVELLHAETARHTLAMMEAIENSAARVTQEVSAVADMATAPI